MTASTAGVDAPPAGADAPPAGADAPPASADVPPADADAPPAGTDGKPLVASVVTPIGADAPPISADAPAGNCPSERRHGPLAHVRGIGANAARCYARVASLFCCCCFAGMSSWRDRCPFVRLEIRLAQLPHDVLARLARDAISDLWSFGAPAAALQKADALLAKAVPLPLWALNNVLLSPDLLSHLFASFELEDHAMARVCSAWREAWRVWQRAKGFLRPVTIHSHGLRVRHRCQPQQANPTQTLQTPNRRV
jgi:hypothetical protein